MKFRKTKNNKLAAVIAVLLIFALASGYFLFFKSQKASAAWWNDSKKSAFGADSLKKSNLIRNSGLSPNYYHNRLQKYVKA
ncbi:MAG: hypothetical protein Q7R92_00600 [bacterium]|nr:hypothetical protein [bacterium]